MPFELTIPLGVIVASEQTNNPWQDHRWRPVSVFFDAPKISNWTEIRRGPGVVQYHAATLELELHRKEVMAYRVNLANGEPSVYVVLRDDETNPTSPIEVHQITASPFEAQSHGELGFDYVEPVPMPSRLVGILEEFIQSHHGTEAFHKRKRNKGSRPEEHTFGQEPLVVLRERMGRDPGQPVIGGGPDQIANRQNTSRRETSRDGTGDDEA